MDPKRWLALTVLLVATFMDLLDANIITVAIPSIQRDLGASAVAVQAMTAGYTLSFAVLLITGGRLGDIFGRKRMFLTGVAGFVVASALCAAAQNTEMLVASRALQGLAAAIMVPQVLALIHVTFAPQEVGRVVSLYASMIGLAIVSGPVVGGALVDWSPLGLGWRSIFVVNLPVGVAALIGAWKWMRESNSPHAKRLDIIGMLLAIVGLLLLMLPLTLGRELDWPLWSIVALVAAAPVIALFVVYERHKTRKDGSPLVTLSLFKVRAFGAGIGVQLLFSAIPAGFFLSWTLYLQGGLGWSALHTGLTAIPFSICVPLVGGLAVRKLFPLYGRYCLMAGALSMLAGIASYAWMARHEGADITSWHAIPSMLLLGSGMGLLMPPLTALVLREVTPQEAGAASGIINATGQLGAALGVAVISGVFFSALASNAGPEADRVVPAVRAVAPQQAEAVKTCATDSLGQDDLSKVPRSCTELAENGDRGSQGVVSGALGEIRAKTFVSTYSETLYWAAGGLVPVTGLLFLLPHHRVRREEMA
ncbi:MFS transporter [Streptomyces syringium]|uniref:EmrB/QacA subfamily drug resistance transporter n=1 Tax=Streptomyces syringium TaxID=76729 RepID=A0ABS4YCL4_9ACTN|nr:MFS transporter [Streptomyces syringium]MBP2406540.1 EmrB/QacA subfamily drug resistance transporter [Streptomyces syringium]